MSFSKSTTTYGGRQTDAASPYDRAKGEWDNRIGSARAEAFHWRLIALVAIVGMLGLGAGLVHVSARKDIKTYIVEIDQLGQPGRITLADSAYRPDAAQTAYFIGQLVRLVRARPLDPVVIRENWKTAYGYLAGDAVHTINSYAAGDPPLRSVDGRRLTRTVAITNVLKKTADTFQVRWVETTFYGGAPDSPQQHTGLFHVQRNPPRNEADVFRNPLGIYVDAISWSREFTDPVMEEPSPSAEPSQPTNQEPEDDQE